MLKHAFTIAGRKTLRWEEINAGTSKHISHVEGEIRDGVRIAKYEDYKALFDDKNIQQGYGVLYGDEANATCTKIQDVYEYRVGADGKRDSGYGMRGCFVYNKSNGKHVFFPS